MWEDFFYYSKSERRSILVLISIGILLLIGGAFSHSYVIKTLIDVDSISVDSFCVQAYHKKYRKDSVIQKKRRKWACQTPVLVNFDPNTADSALFRSLGLPAYLTKRIINYRAKGGRFRKVEDFSRIYGLSEQRYRTLKPYIHITSISEANNQMSILDDSVSLNGAHANLVSKPFYPQLDTLKNHFVRDSSFIKYPVGTVLDLNKVDTTQLKHIPGIGSRMAAMIVSYRNKLGGFSDVKQLQEVSRVDTTFNKWFVIETSVFRPLRVNRLGLDMLRNHPYMNFYKAKAILEYRRKRGRIKGLSQLSMFQEFSEKDLQRLKPYLDFN